MPFGPLNFDDLSDSAYAQELGAGVARLRFQGALERQYLAVHLQHVHTRVRAWFSLWLALAVVFSIAQSSRTGIESVAFWTEAAGGLCALVLAWATWSSQYQRHFMPLARLLVPLRGVLIAVLVAQVPTLGHEEELMLLTVILIGVFFFTGLMFRAALLSALAMVAAFTLSSLATGALSRGLPNLVVLLLATLIGAIVHRDVEMSERKNFLEDALLAELSMRDGLTGLMNRRALDEHLLRLWQQGQRDRRSLALLMIDIDHFKSFNDLYGHQAGDAALRCVGKVLREFARRPLDMVARYGGEEFVVILYDLPQTHHVHDIAERIRRGVQETALPVGSAQARVSVSIGVGLIEPTLGRTPQGALQFADEALYEAKTQGRDRVVFNDPSRYVDSETGNFRKSGTGPA